MTITNDVKSMNIYSQLSSGKRINGASDDAAGLAIAQKMETQIRGYSRGTQNAEDSKNLYNTAESALGSVNDNLQRMRELSVQASNGTLTDGDRAIIQTEIEQIKSSISDVAKNTSFNTQTLLDGTFSDKNIASNPRGTGSKMSIKNSSLESLGIADFDVTKEFDIKQIDDAIQKVSDARSDIGAKTNALERTIKYNENDNQKRNECVDLDFNNPNLAWNRRRNLFLVF